MAKNILDEILKEDKSDIISNENEILSELLNEINLINDDSIASFVFLFIQLIKYVEFIIINFLFKRIILLSILDMAIIT